MICQLFRIIVHRVFMSLWGIKILIVLKTWEWTEKQILKKSEWSVQVKAMYKLQSKHFDEKVWEKDIMSH